MNNRKRNRLLGYDYSRDNLYFVTNCVKNNECCFGNVVHVETGRDLSVQNKSQIHPSQIHQELEYKVELNKFGLIIAEKINWLMVHYTFVDIHNFVVMPNHFHLILEIDSQKVIGQDVKIKSLSSLMGALKTTTSRAIHSLGLESFAWHRSFHDHIIRNEKSYQNISNYIDNNPSKWFQDKFYNQD